MVDFANPFGSLLEGYRLGEADYIKAEEAKRRRRAQDLDFYLKSTERGFLTDQNTIAFERDLARLGVLQGYEQANLGLEYGLRDQNADSAHRRTLERDLVTGAIDGKVGGSAVGNFFSRIFGNDFSTMFGGAGAATGDTTGPALSYGSAVEGSPEMFPASARDPGAFNPFGVAAAPGAERTPTLELELSRDTAGQATGMQLLTPEQGAIALNEMDRRGYSYTLDERTGVVYGEDGTAVFRIQ